MREADKFDDVAEQIVFWDAEARTAIETGDDARLSWQIAKVLREHFANQPAPTETGPYIAGVDMGAGSRTVRVVQRVRPEIELTEEAEPAPQGAPVKCEYHPIYRECVRCGGAMSRSDDLECPEPNAKEVVK